MSKIKELKNKNLISPPSFLIDSVQYEVLMGSVAYGVSGESSDWDVYGFCIPPKEDIFPHLRGEINGFGKQKNRFEQFQQHHVIDKNTDKEYDFSIYSIVKYFQLCMENNPNMIDSLFVPQRCVLHATKIGQLVRENRRSFLHKGSWHKFKGYAYSQLHKIKTKTAEGKRKEIVDKYGFDVKFAYHTVRLLNEVEQILTEGDLNLERNNEQLKAVRSGEWSLQQIEDYFNFKEKSLEELYTKSTLPYGPDEEKIKILLLNCLEEYYGSLEKCLVLQNKEVLALNEIKSVLEKYKV